MKVLTFSGSSPQEALKMAQIELGDDAILIETRELQKKALGKKPLYEVVVGIDEQEYQKRARKQPEPTYSRVEKKTSSADNEILLNISEAAKTISEIADVANEPKHSATVKPIPKPLQDSKELKDIKDEIAKLADKVKLIQNMFWDEKTDHLDLKIPPEFSEIYNLAKSSGMKKTHLDTVMSLTLEHMPLKMRESTTTVKRYFQVLMRKMIPIRIESTPSNGAKKIIMLVGPTGVGKTTSIAKLAARYSYLLEKKHKVGLIVLDTYRIGAVEQLMQYARMMKLGIETVVDPPEFSNALRSLNYCNYILIDTMGSSPYDKQKLEKIYQVLNANETQHDIDVVLVLPSSIKYDDLLMTYESFSKFNIDTLMFTKLDETRDFGNVFSLAYETKKPISYFSIGQEVPEDLIVAESDFLINCLLNGFSRGRH